MDKSQIRSLVRQRRQALSTADHRQAAAGLLKQLLSIDALQFANRIALYLVNDGEIDTREVIHWCWKQGKSTWVPMVQAGTRRLSFAEVKSDTRFEKNRFGILEPIDNAGQRIEAAELDLVLAPLVAFDAKGDRIGMGGGFYDTTFDFLKHNKTGKPEVIGVAHQCQQVDKIDPEPWDMPLSTVVTDQHVYRFTD